MTKQVGWCATLSLVAALTGIVVASQALLLMVAIAGEWVPEAVMLPSARVAYEASLWGSGLATAMVARRLGWLNQKLLVAIVVAAPAVLETLLALGLGRVSPGFATWTGAIARLLVGTGAIWLAIRSSRR